MASSYSTRFRLNYQAPGDNLNTWGTLLNTGVFQLLEDAVGKRVAFALSGSKTLTSANGSTDEARCAVLDVTSGTGGTITIPSVEKLYVLRNGASGDVVLTTGAGTTATIKAGEIISVVCDATNVRKFVTTDMGGARLSSLADPTSAQDAATKAYADALAFTANAGILPGQGGNAGRFLTTNGTTASWGGPTYSASPTAASLALPDSGNTVRGYLYADNAGGVALLNASGAARLSTDSAGNGRLYADGDLTGQPIATQAFANAVALALAVAMAAAL